MSIIFRHQTSKHRNERFFRHTFNLKYIVKLSYIIIKLAKKEKKKRNEQK